MSTPDGRYVVAFNGEIYNFRELRDELASDGTTFRSRSDTEVLLAAFAKWGVRSVQRLRGMFAFVVWDAMERKLFLLRDRLGIKPLYYVQIGGLFACASEVKALLQLPTIKAELDSDALFEYLTFQNMISEQTLFRGIRLLPAGHVGEYAENETLTVSRYWDYTPGRNGFLSEPDVDDHLGVAIRRSVQRHLVADVPVGAYLSGGLDSAGICALASRTTPRLLTFTAGFDMANVTGIEAVFDERPLAELVASEIGSEHYEMVVHHGDMGWALPRLIWHVEEPRMGMSYQNWYIARLASRFVKVTLSGIGGDELLGGYPWRYSPFARDFGSLDETAAECHSRWHRLLPPERLLPAVHFERRSGLDQDRPRRLVRDTFEPVAGMDPLEQILYFEIKTFLHGLLVLEDKLTMAHSIESRVPLLDDDLVATSERIPARMKFDATTGKKLLRKQFAPILPDRVVSAKKQGFSPPDQNWYRDRNMPYIESMLLTDRFHDRKIFSAHAVRTLLDEHRLGQANHRLAIWSLMCLEWWHRIFIDGETPGADA